MRLKSLIISLFSPNLQRKKASKERRRQEEGAEEDEEETGQVPDLVGMPIRTREGRKGVVIAHDPNDPLLEVKVKFLDDAIPETDQTKLFTNPHKHSISVLRVFLPGMYFNLNNIRGFNQGTRLYKTSFCS